MWVGPAKSLRFRARRSDRDEDNDMRPDIVAGVAFGLLSVLSAAAVARPQDESSSPALAEIAIREPWGVSWGAVWGGRETGGRPKQRPFSKILIFVPGLSIGPCILTFMPPDYDIDLHLFKRGNFLPFVLLILKILCITLNVCL